MSPRRKKKEPESKARINLVVDQDLRDWMFEYAKRRRTKVSRLIADYFITLKEREDAGYIEQI
jgi:hypothetical protein